MPPQNIGAVPPEGAAKQAPAEKPADVAEEGSES